MREEWRRFESAISDRGDDLEDVCSESFGECDKSLEVSLDVLFEERHPYMRFRLLFGSSFGRFFPSLIGCLPLCIRQEVP